ncbi:DUF3102 domain-containing protein [Lactiplantibacillus plantarum]|uniref:DUF3102 domain-containing protein n=1 Tax=Lactiplantibacillus plantarum TaxID=1590 RepID=UPI001BA47164|nr:DUF3102 domain-containing protein [Lactiplantibacillus plantarum]MBS0935700.1 DUF3102 domain-containing protein [Lactiplantibacillus plantarum]MBS0943943.1 DUF3102 domain-containing protein [Lactiplantibacillus plantarum]MBS0955468.1 DUF3102 domain-containing protein [Lactiplantibacillus plantarum]
MTRKDITGEVTEQNDNEVDLSTNLKQLTAEIKTYQTVAGQSIFEIGRRLKFVKDHNLAHGDYLKWLASMNIERTFAARTIKIVSELSSNVATWQHLSSRALYEIATLPDEERHKLHQLESGEIKSPADMSVRELEQVKKQLKREQAEHEAAKKDLTAKYEARLARLKKEGVREVEVPVKVIPDDYEDLKQQNQGFQRQISDMQILSDEGDREIETLIQQRNEYAKSSEDYARLTDEVEQLKHQKSLLLANNEANRGFNQLVQRAIEAADLLSQVIDRRDFTQLDKYDTTMAQLFKLKDKMQLNVQRLDAGLMQNPWQD